jgi:rhodanese-related sulfurtransferase
MALVAIALSPIGAICAAAEPDAAAVSLDTARAEHEAGRAVLIDIREREEHATGVAAGARLLPMSQLSSRLGEIPTDPKQPVLLICNTQNRSSATLKALRERGYSHVKYVNGGMSEWARRGWPMVKPPR